MTHSTYTTRDRTFDYLERRWLEKTTGRPAPEWDCYIIKELLDNALDADERWSREHGGMPTLTVDLHYRNNAALKLNSLDIAVSNRAPFPEPAEMLPAIFDLSAYTSNKSHYNYPTRGHQGNALKTILGIPYALHLYYYGDYHNLRKPLEIETGENAWLLTLDIDEKQQQVTVGPIAPEPLATPCAGTCIRVGIDRFVQENPRTLDDLHTWARQFALLNPHATFHWRVTMGQERVVWEFPADPTWDNLFRDAAPIHWYEYTQVRDLLLALERKHGEAYPLEEALQTFAGFTTQEDPHGKRARALCHRVGYQTLGDLRLTSDHNRTLRNGLLKALLREGRRIGADTLGGLGETQTIATLTAMFALEHPPRYYRIPHDNPDDPYHPFVLELTVARLPEGYRRHIWTGLNHTPTYEDPFYTEQFLLPEREGDYVQGLDGVLDAYGQTSDRPVLLLLHLICPNFTFRDFSKTQIDRRPFREVLVATLHQLLTEFRAAQQHELENLQPVVHALLPNILQTLSPGGEKIAFAQLLRWVRRRLVEQLQQEGRADLAERWMTDPTATNRLEEYLRTFPGVSEYLIQSERGHLALPVHPDDATTMPLRRVSQQVLEEACVNKLLLVADPDLEAMIMANGLLCRFDAALLPIEGSFDQSFDALLPYLGSLRCPLVLLHHATPSGCLLAQRVQARLTEAGHTHIALYDLGLTPAQGLSLRLPTEPGPGSDNRAALSQTLSDDEVAFLADQRQQMSLFSLTVDAFVAWIAQRCEQVGLPPKHIPHDDELNKAVLESIREQVRHRLIRDMHLDHQADQRIQQQQESGQLRVAEIVQRVRDTLHAEPHRAWRAVVGEGGTREE